MQGTGTNILEGLLEHKDNVRGFSFVKWGEGEGHKTTTRLREGGMVALPIKRAFFGDFFFVHLQQIDAKKPTQGPTRITQGKRLQTMVRPELNYVSE